MSDIEFLSQLCGMMPAFLSRQQTGSLYCSISASMSRSQKSAPSDAMTTAIRRTSSAPAQPMRSMRRAVSYVNPETGQCEGIAKVEGYTEDPNNQQLEITAKVGTVDEGSGVAERISVFATNPAARHNSCCRRYRPRCGRQCRAQRLGRLRRKIHHQAGCPQAGPAAAIVNGDLAAHGIEDMDGRRKSVKSGSFASEL